MLSPVDKDPAMANALLEGGGGLGWVEEQKEEA